MSRMDGVITLERGIQLKRWARHFKERMQVSSVLLSKGRYGRERELAPPPRKRADEEGCVGVPAVMVMKGMVR